MEEAIAAFIHENAPRPKHAEWHQKGVKRTLKNWETARPDDYSVALETSGFDMAVGYWIRWDGVGRYGFDTGHHFKPNLDEHILEDDDARELVQPFYETWVENIQSAIAEEQEATLFTPKEFATFIAYQNPSISEREAADALSISVGTYRGKVGRVKEKLSGAKATTELDSACGQAGDTDSDGEENIWEGMTFSSPFSVLLRVDESRLPVNALARSEGPLDLDDIPVDDLIIEK